MSSMRYLRQDCTWLKCKSSEHMNSLKHRLTQSMPDDTVCQLYSRANESSYFLWAPLSDEPLIGHSSHLLLGYHWESYPVCNLLATSQLDWETSALKSGSSPMVQQTIDASFVLKE